MIVDTKRKLATKFEMKDLGMMHYFLGMEVWQNADGIFLGQGKYGVDILKKSLYGLKQVPKTWYSRIESSLSSLGFTKSKADSNLYYKVEEGNPVIESYCT